MINKSVKLHKITRHLVKHCSLFSWFSSLISVARQRLNGNENKLFLKHVLVALKVSKRLILIRFVFPVGCRKVLFDFPLKCVGIFLKLWLVSLHISLARFVH